MDRFAAIDVETANEDLSSICQVGIAIYEGGKLTQEWEALVNPESYFSDMNVEIHGIDEDDVENAPTFSEVAGIITGLLDGNICVCHTHFDKSAITKAFDKNGIIPPVLTWLDSARVARRAWEDVAYYGYGLSNLCERIGYSFKHHNALEDAKASANILLAAIEYSGIELRDWIKRVKQPLNPEISAVGKHVERDGNPDGPLFGEVVVFTGSLEITRSEAADIAASLGCTVKQGVTKKTTMLVVGDQDITLLAGKNKSSKHIRAEELIKNGQAIKILQESDFKMLFHKDESEKRV